ILIGKRRKPEELADKWEFPGGEIESDESPEECLRREVSEELGIEIQVKNKICEISHEHDFGNIKFHVFFAEWKNGELTPTTHKEAKWVPRNELRNHDFTPADVKIIKKIENT
ncbi:MAG: (deoxy)nucleoside triphosphate pyrophosphohydrolase, partial [Hadesarchaea archaeon]|nr:(deoxy)nucleoside triphosphate pyrophosphohydrolase [Hadesarchaea archaeon]